MIYRLSVSNEQQNQVVRDSWTTAFHIQKAAHDGNQAVMSFISHLFVKTSYHLHNKGPGAGSVILAGYGCNLADLAMVPLFEFRLA